MNDLKPTDWAYLAALIDGEGCISCAHQRTRVRIGVSQTDPRVLEVLQVLYGVGHINRLRPSNSRHYRFVWAVHRQDDVKWLLTGILPWSIVKRYQALAALRLIQTRDPKYRDLLKRLKCYGFVAVESEPFEPSGRREVVT